ncbi:hypothetical protein D3C81_1965000 [compost metagenome]
MNRIRQPLQFRNVSVIRDGQELFGGGRPIYRTDLYNIQTTAALRPRDMIVNKLLGDITVISTHFGSHGWENNAVLQFQSSDLNRAK